MSVTLEQQPSLIVTVEFSTEKMAYDFFEELHGSYDEYLCYAFNWINAIGNIGWFAESLPPEHHSTMVTFCTYSNTIMPEMYNVLALMVNIYESFPHMPLRVNVYYRYGNAFGRFESTLGYPYASRFMYDIRDIVNELPCGFSSYADIRTNWDYLTAHRHHLSLEGESLKMPYHETDNVRRYTSNIQDQEEIPL